MNRYVLSFQEIDRTNRMAVGGKGGNLAELSGLKEIHVPDGFCVTTEAYEAITANIPELNDLLNELSRFKAEDRKNISEISGKIRAAIERTHIPENILEEISAALTTFGESDAFAVRSSATAEDLPTASFAGQQDTYLNIFGKQAILKHISKCWASLFTDRAVTYRIRNSYDHRQVHLSVIVQKMVSPEVSGIMFTADPITGNRKLLSVEAGFGLGEAFVSGLVSPDRYKVEEEEIVDKFLTAQQNNQTLTEQQILQLARIGRQIETHFGCPQDIEWCLADKKFYILQSRPVTTLYPIPETNDRENHVYVSVGHQQMMTDPMKPLGLSFFRLTTARPMFTAGGRLFVDVAPDLASPTKRDILVNVLGKSDPLIKDALTTIIERKNFIEPLPNDAQAKPSVDYQTLTDYDPSIVADLIGSRQAAVEDLRQTIQTKSGSDLVDFILEDIVRLRKCLADPQSFGVLMTAMNATSWINEKMKEWLDETGAADTLSFSVRDNITAEMGLELLQVADIIRPYPEVINYLQQVKDNNFLNELTTFDGGRESRDAIVAYLDKYGMRCAGEIDITKPRWSERPLILVPMILNNIRNFEPNSGKRKYEQGQMEAFRKEKELLDRLLKLPDAEQKVKQTKRMIDLIRNFIGYREYPKYHMISRYFIYKQALLKEAERLVQANVVPEKEDIYYLTLEEFGEVIRANKLDYQVVANRKSDHKLYESLTPPRVMTSDGEIITGRYKRSSLPADAIVGLPVSSGLTEGRARVVINMEDADMEEGDILVTKFTDPSWTPLFLSIKGLVTEVGGLMTHGAVIAREYGLPAVVGVEHATRLIKDGQRIRVNGTDGFIEIL
ncbi:MAG TPA: phosphoenolpyruvate synthase [Puia sp.]|jgi:pyruvate,water dikinase|nr:phosphoenolpyruvate synthase [Puia sp.]